MGSGLAGVAVLGESQMLKQKLMSRSTLPKYTKR